MLYLKLIRKICNKSCIRGTLFLCDGSSSLYPICETLEPSPNCLLFTKECGTLSYPAVEEGCYAISISYSPKFKTNLPLIDVPKRQGIRIHAGNNAFDTSGCVLVGVYGNSNSIMLSRVALKHVLNVIKESGVSKIIFENSSKLF